MGNEVIVEHIFVRPSTNVPWFSDTFTQEYLNHVIEKYVRTGKFSSANVVSSDGLTMMQTSTWTTKDDHNEWMADDYLATWRANRHAYNEEKGIIEY